MDTTPKGAICKGLARASKTYSERWLIYVCPTGGTEVGFEVGDLRKHVGSCFSNLLCQDKQAIEREAMSRLSDENAFVDFYCQGCGMAVRVYDRYDPPDQNYGLLHLKRWSKAPHAGQRRTEEWTRALLCGDECKNLRWQRARLEMTRVWV